MAIRAVRPGPGAGRRRGHDADSRARGGAGGRLPARPRGCSTTSGSRRSRSPTPPRSSRPDDEVTVHLDGPFDASRVAERHFVATASCGICGKATPRRDRGPVRRRSPTGRSSTRDAARRSRSRCARPRPCSRHGRPPRGGPVRRHGSAARAARGRRPPQRARQAGRRASCSPGNLPLHDGSSWSRAGRASSSSRRPRSPASRSSPRCPPRATSPSRRPSAWA